MGSWAGFVPWVVGGLAHSGWPASPLLVVFLFRFFFVKEKRERRKVILRGCKTPKTVDPIYLHLATEIPRCPNFFLFKILNICVV